MYQQMAAVFKRVLYLDVFRVIFVSLCHHATFKALKHLMNTLISSR